MFAVSAETVQTSSEVTDDESADKAADKTADIQEPEEYHEQYIIIKPIEFIARTWLN